MINTGRSKMLDSGFFENEIWGALHKAWKGYVIAKNKKEYDKMVRYARIIQENQHDLGLGVSSFPDIGMSASKFYFLHGYQISKNNSTSKSDNRNNYNNSHKTAANNNTNTENGEHLADDGQIDKEDKLTDDNTQEEYFKDDYNKDDRFDYQNEDRLTRDDADNEYFKDDYDKDDRFSS